VWLPLCLHIYVRAFVCVRAHVCVFVYGFGCVCISSFDFTYAHTHTLFNTLSLSRRHIHTWCIPAGQHTQTHQISCLGTWVMEPYPHTKQGVIYITWRSHVTYTLSKCIMYSTSDLAAQSLSSKRSCSTSCESVLSRSCMQVMCVWPRVTSWRALSNPDSRDL